MKVLIDAGHGIDTQGKRSPDGRLREYRWARDMAQLLSRALSLKGIDTMLITPEEHDVPLSERIRRVNAWCAKLGASNVLLISIHNNAAKADGKWHDARGFSVYVSKNASSASKRLAATLTDEAAEARIMGNRWVPPVKYWTWPTDKTADIAILSKTKCPAVLTENLYQDNRQDVDYLLSEQGMQTIVDVHVRAIMKFLKS